MGTQNLSPEEEIREFFLPYANVKHGYHDYIVSDTLHHRTTPCPLFVIVSLILERDLIFGEELIPINDDRTRVWEGIVNFVNHTAWSKGTEERDWVEKNIAKKFSWLISYWKPEYLSEKTVYDAIMEVFDDTIRQLKNR